MRQASHIRHLATGAALVALALATPGLVQAQQREPGDRPKAAGAIGI